MTEFFNPNHDGRGRFSTGASIGTAKSVTRPDGGFTFNPIHGREATEGFAISPYPERSTVLDVDKMSPKQIRTAINQYAATHREVIKQDGHFVGGWRDPQPGGKVYLDVSIVTKDAAEARKLALKHDQIAYFDFQTGQSVQVNADATSGQKKDPVKALEGKDPRSMSNREKILAAEAMFGTNSAQHRAAKKKFK